MRMLEHFAKTVIITLCLLPMPLAAQQAEPARVTHIYFGIEGGLGSLRRSVHIHENGNVEISGERCVGCRWHAPYKQQFDLSADNLRQIKSLFDVDALDRASRAPCTMEAAGQSKMRHYISVSLEGVSRSFEFVQNCTSPELKIVRDQLAEANSILAKAAPPAKNTPE